MDTNDNANAITMTNGALETEQHSNEVQQFNLAEEGDSNACIEPAKNSSGARSPLSGLLHDMDESDLIALASNTALDGNVQERLASFGTPAVREALAINPILSEQQQHYLALTGSDEVKCQLAKNPSLIVTIQSMFAIDATPGIREALAGNPSLDKSCQQKLMEDSDEYGQQIVYTLMPLASNPALASELHNRMAAEEDNRVVASFAKNPSLPEALMKKFLSNDNEEVRAGLACNTSLPEAMQARLIAGNSDIVRENIARNPSLKIAQQAQLAHAGNVDVRLALLDNPSLDEKIKSRVASSFTSRDLSSAENALDYAEKQSARLCSEHQEAMQKCIKSYGGIFPSSEEKIERLHRFADRIQGQINGAERDVSALENKCRKIRLLLEKLPVDQSANTVWPFGMTGQMSQVG